MGLSPLCVVLICRIYLYNRRELMLIDWITKLVDFSVRHAWRVILTALLLVAGSAYYVAGHFAINTDISRLIDTNAAWARRDAAVSQAFPQRDDLTLVVVRAPAPEFAAQAARELAARLQDQPALFRAVSLQQDSAFFRHNGLMFLSPREIDDLSQQLIQAKPLLNELAHDPSLRGLANLLSVSLLVPLQTGQLHLPDMAKLLTRSADTIDATLAGRPAALSWRALVDSSALDGGTSGGTGGASLIEVRPRLDYSALEPGQASSDAIRAAAVELKLAQRYGASVKLTGPTPLSDEEFSSVQEGAALNGIVTFAVVLLILWLALRSVGMVFAVFATLLGGLIVTAALGLMLVGALNMISVAFAVLFVGIGVDFGIQFGVRLREERQSTADIRAALVATSRSIALPLTLAAAATAASFLAFLPTAYRGVSELGQIAGIGILCVAFPSCLTVLPAMVSLMRPRSAAAVPGYRWLAPVDRCFETYRKPLLTGTIALIAAGLPLLWHLHFDFNPLHLKNPRSESMATLLSLKDASAVGINNVQVLAPSLANAQAQAARLAQVPQVDQAMTLASFVPDQQAEKLQALSALSAQLMPVLEQTPSAPANDMERVIALRNAARALRNAALDHEGPGAAEARRLAASLNALAKADPALRDRAEWALAQPLKLSLATLRDLLQPQAITLATLPPDLVRDWVAPDGQALIDISPRIPKGVDPNDDTMLRRFTQAVLQAAPTAIGGPISILHSADLIVKAFIEAAILAVIAITLLLWIALRRFDDVLRTMIPLLVSGLVTLELCVILGISLNFANIIALPLLLGVGVAFKIYYVMAWRNGKASFLQSGLTQAVILSAATTGTAFGSLWLSHHPGTASMGKLLVLSLVCTLIGAVFFQPILMGKPRAAADR